MERALLVELVLNKTNDKTVSSSLEELSLLAETAGVSVVEKILQKRRHVDPATYIGKGKAFEIASLCDSSELDCVIFDSDLLPNQVRNLEEIFNKKVIDRSELIMDIFASHARTAEAKIQVELAQLNYRLPRLTGKGIALSRLGGGIGTRGPGLTKLEVDRRKIRDRISYLQHKLKKITKTREIQRKQRQNFYRISIVGYTNTGKSMLFNSLTNSSVRVEDKLFATLDATTRKFHLFGDNKKQFKVLLSDTVGFINKLPPHLIASFRSTLEEVIESDLLLHVIDISHPDFRNQMEVVTKILNELKLHEKLVMKIFNKIDICIYEEIIKELKLEFPDAIFISAKERIGIEELKKKIISKLNVH